ncbi:MAG TPA: histidinol-phosphate transaminase [Mizugakiibacter sp.]|nr:histidinol-phosphate transaminase [Mizugakiibacter sp.]
MSIEDVLALARAEVRALTPYLSARMEAGKSAVMLNANESPWPPQEDAGLDLNRYPEPQPKALRERLAALYGVTPEQLLLGRGSDEMIDLLVRGFCRPGQDAVAITPPTFSMYALCAAVQGARLVTVPLSAESFMVRAEALRDACQEGVKLVFLCSPNNPTGGRVPLEVIDYIATELSGRAVLIVDEAYIEYAQAPSVVTLLSRHPNLGVLHTLSKAWALAGVRIGALLAHADIVTLLQRIMSPYPLPTPCVAMAMAAVDESGERLMHERVRRIIEQREQLARRLRAWPGVQEVLVSRANFLCVRFTDAERVYRQLGERGVVVRNLSRYPGLHDALRLSVGTAEDNACLVDALQSLTEVV